MVISLIMKISKIILAFTNVVDISDNVDITNSNIKITSISVFRHCLGLSTLLIKIVMIPKKISDANIISDINIISEYSYSHIIMF